MLLLAVAGTSAVAGATAGTFAAAAAAGTASAAAAACTLTINYLIPPPFILNEIMLCLPAIDTKFAKALDLADGPRPPPPPPMICML